MKEIYCEGCTNPKKQCLCEKPNNPQAFPTSTKTVVQQTGMTLRDYFAAKSMQGMESNLGANDKTVKEIAIRSYKMADAMLKQRDT